MALEPFLVLTQDVNKKAHPMKVTIAIEFSESAKEESLKSFTPRIRDATLGYLRLVTYEDALDSAKSEKLRAEILERLQGRGRDVGRARPHHGPRRSMSDATPPRIQLLRFALEGERVRKASAVLERESPQLAAALRRAVPSSDGGHPCRSGLCARDADRGAARGARAPHPRDAPGHDARERPRRCSCSMGARSRCSSTASSAATGSRSPFSIPPASTRPQSALITGLAAGIVRAFSEALSPAIGVRLECRAADVDEATAESAPIACVLELGEGEKVGRVILLLPKEVLLVAAGETEPPSRAGVDPRIIAVLEDVELDLVVRAGSTSDAPGRRGAR